MGKPATEKRPSESQSINRAVTVLRAVAERPGASLGEIARATDLARSTVQRIVGALNTEGFVTKTFGQQGVYLGMELARLGAQVNLDARKLLRPLMQDLHERIGDNIDLTTLNGNQVIVIEQIASNEDIRVMSYVGKQHPIHCTANGKAHLGMLGPDDARRLLGPELNRFTPNSIVDPERLLDQIEEFRRQNLYIDREEYGLDACAVATTLPVIDGQQYAVSIAMPSARFARREDDLRVALIDFRHAVTAAYGSSI